MAHTPRGAYAALSDCAALRHGGNSGETAAGVRTAVCILKSTNVDGRRGAIFASAIVEGRPIKLFNQGWMQRDFTYVDDVTEALVRLIDHVPRGNPDWSGAAPDPGSSAAPWRIYNVGNNRPEELMRVVAILEQKLGCKAKKELLPMQPGDVPATYADVDDLVRDVDFRQATPIEEGIGKFVAWYRRYRDL
jgi:UDP-glucuronate 4-epimerase